MKRTVPLLFVFLYLFISCCYCKHARQMKVGRRIRQVSTFVTSIAITFSSQLPLPAHAISSNEIATKLAATQGANVQSSRKLGLVRGTLQGCSADENCFSTSARAAGKRMSPWTYEGSFDEKQPDLVWSRIEQACIKEGLTVLQNKHDKEKIDNYYLLAATV